MNSDITPNKKRPGETTPQPVSYSDDPEEPVRRVPASVIDSVESQSDETKQAAPSSFNIGRPSTSAKLRKTIIALLCTVLGVIIAVAIGSFVWYTHQLSAVDASSDEKVAVTIEPGTGLSQIAETLEINNVIRNRLAFEWYVRQNGQTSLLQSGSYRLAKNEAVPEIVKHLTSGNTDTFSITFLPGATLAKHRQVLIDAGYSTSEVDAALTKQYTHPIFESKPASVDLEGYIYGETYNFPASATVEQILTRTFDQFETVVKDNNLVSEYKAQGFSLYQGITMASIIQREVATAADAAQVAQVFKKRYDMGMQLGSDVTYQYIADKTGVERSVDLDSPYNTRRYTGLPPGPISSPGIAALKAVGEPAAGEYLYFLSGDDDKTYFATTNEEHERNIREHCQKKCQII